MARARFCSWLRSSCMATTMPVGLWVMRTAESVVFTLWPPGPDERYTSIWRSFGIDVDIDLVGLGQHRHRGRRRVHPALALGDRHPLHPVRAALELQVAPRAVAPHHERDLVEAAEVGRVGRQHLQLPARAQGVGLVHVEQVAGEEVGLLAALGAADLDDDVLALVGVLGQQQHLELVLEAGQVVLGLGHLDPGQLALVAGGLGEQLPGGGQVVLGGWRYRR